MGKAQNGLEWNQVIVDGAELAGNTSLFSPIVGQTLYKRSEEVLIGLGEPGIMIMDFAKVGLVDSSTLLISIARLVALVQSERWQKTILCSHTTEMHQRALSSAIIHYPYTTDWWDQDRRLLILVSGRKEPGEWQLLGDLTEEERTVWKLAVMRENITTASVSNYLRITQNTVESILKVFLDNRILLERKAQQELVFCPLYGLLAVHKEGG